MKNIHYILWKAAPGGLEKVVNIYLSSSLKQEYRLNIFSLRPSESDFLSSNNVPVHFGADSKIRLYPIFFKYALKNKNDIFHLLNSGPLILLILRITGVKKIIYHIHGTKYWNKPIKKIMLKPLWYLGLSDRVYIISNSRHSKNIFLKEVKQKCSISVVYNPVEVGEFQPAQNRRKRTIRICFVGRLVKSKNLDTWLSVANYIFKHNQAFEFHLYGEGPMREFLEQRIKEYKMTDRFFFHGFVSPMKKEYPQNDLLLFLSEYESFGNVVIEAILSGIPVIVSDIPSHKEILKDYPEFLVSLDERIEINVLKKIKCMNSLKESAIKARKEFIEKFKPDNHINRIKDIYLSLETF